MPLMFENPPDAKYLIYVKESTNEDRRIVILIEGVCKMEECVTFILRYPTNVITAATEHTIPISSDCFEGEVNVQVRGYTMATAGQVIPKWLEFLTNEYGGTIRFTDAYTFNTMKHMLAQQMR